MAARISRAPVKRQPSQKAGGMTSSKRTLSSVRAKFLPATCLLALTSCGAMPTRAIALPERLIPIDKLLTPFELLFRGEIFAAFISIPMVPFVEIGEMVSGKSIFAPAFSPDEWKSPYSGAHAGEIYNASQEARDQAAKK